jgi:hypothetical protein
MVANTQDSRLKKDAGNSRVDRAAEDQKRSDADGTILTQSERRRMFRNEWTQEALPNAPEIPGYHLCWLSTTSSYDPIQKRMRMGYEPVMASEIPGFEHLKMKSGEFEGVVSVNEMVLFKIPLEIYNDLMDELHNAMPLEQELLLKDTARIDGRDSNGKELGSFEGDGFGSLGRANRH